MNKKILEITKDTKVATLLDYYPELEETLIAMAPPFQKLKTPVLRRSVAKVASLRQAAVVGGLSVNKMVNALRAAVGQPSLEIEEVDESQNYFGSQPNWFDEKRIVIRTNEDKDFPENQMPITIILKKCNLLKTSEIFELRASFLPAPGIDLMRAKGFVTWSSESSNNEVITYFSKPNN